jgi:tRNA(Leu) C34 or U34 (ribose-2'-O)-methylase TrmL
VAGAAGGFLLFVRPRQFSRRDQQLQRRLSDSWFARNNSEHQTYEQQQDDAQVPHKGR